MKQIVLTQDKVALVDDEDFDRINQFKWCARLDPKNGSYYAERGVWQGPTAKPKIKCIKMHRFIVGVTDRKIHVDHKDGNTLNNTKSNLRIATPTQNGANRRSNKNNVWGFRGIYFRKQYNKPWVAQINRNGKRVTLGYFSTAEEAARCFDKAAKEIYGEFCGKLNFE